MMGEDSHMVPICYLTMLKYPFDLELIHLLGLLLLSHINVRAIPLCFVAAHHKQWKYSKLYTGFNSTWIRLTCAQSRGPTGVPLNVLDISLWRLSTHIKRCLGVSKKWPSILVNLFGT